MKGRRAVFGAALYQMSFAQPVQCPTDGRRPDAITASPRTAIPCHAALAEKMIRVQAMAARTACERMTPLALETWHDSVERASRLPTRPGWERKAAAHAEIFRLLTSLVDGPAAADQRAWTRQIRDLMLAAGPAANGMIINSRQRLLEHLREGDADGAALEVENHLKVLHFMWRVAATARQVS